MSLDVELATDERSVGEQTAWSWNDSASQALTLPLSLRQFASPLITTPNNDRDIGEPAIFKDGSFVAPLLLVLQTVAPALIAVVVLYVLTVIYEVKFNAPFVGLAAITAALSLALLQPQRNVVSRLLTGKLPLVLGLAVRWAIMLAVLLAIGYLTQYSEEYSRRVLATWAVATPALVIGVSLLLQEVVRRLMIAPANVRNVVFVGCNAMSVAMADRLKRHAELCMSVLGFFDDRGRARLGEHNGMPLLGRLTELSQYIKQPTNGQSIDAIFISLPLRDVPRVRQLLAQLQDTTVSVYYLPDIPVPAPSQVRSCELLGMPLVALCEAPFYGCRAVVKRLMDMALSAAALIVFAPLLLAIAVAVKMSSPGPAIFRQRRYGLNGQEIVVYKFRTMTVTEDGAKVRQATRNDCRTTPLGKFLRRFSLDELPQLINVLQGRMSLVGPRPHAVAHNEEYRKLIPGYMIRHKVLPGMTGLAQINGCRGEISRLDDMQARVHYDLEYLRNWSPLLDFKIMLLTIPRALSTEKAY